MLIKILFFGFVVLGVFGALRECEAATNSTQTNQTESQNGNNNNKEVAEPADKSSFLGGLFGSMVRRATLPFLPAAIGLNIILIPILIFARIIMLFFRGFINIVSFFERNILNRILRSTGLGRMANGIQCIFAVANHSLLGISCALSKMTYFGSVLSTCQAYKNTMDDNFCVNELE